MARYAGARRRTLIVGGYGHVGRRIAERLVDGGISQCRLAGRDGAKAARAAQALACEGAALVLETMLLTKAAPGALHIEQRLSIADLADRLRAEGVSLSLPASA